MEHRRKESIGGEGGEEGESLRLCLDLPKRIRGLLFSAPRRGSMLLMPCNDVHTVGMRHKLDIAFVNDEGIIVSVHRGIGPFRRLKNKHAIATIERFSSCDPWFEAGDQIAIGCRRKRKRLDGPQNSTE